MGRVRVQIQADDLIVLRVPMEFKDHDQLNAELKGDPDTGIDDLELYVESADSRWYVPDDNPSQYTTFNCATYAIGDLIGLSKLDWLEPCAAAWTKEKCPAQSVLSQYFDLVVRFPLAEIDWHSLESSPLIQLGDVITFSRIDEGDHVHLGKVIQDFNRRRLVSKLGSGPLSQGSIHATSRRFEGEFSEVRVYRLRATSFKS